MWDEIVRLLPEFPRAVLTGRDADGYPVSLRCRPQPEPSGQILRVAIADFLGIQPGPASLLCHKHDARLWNQKSFLVRGTLERTGAAWIFRPAEFIPGIGLGGALGLLRFVLDCRRAAQRYLAARRLPRPRVPWDEINAIKRQAFAEARKASAESSQPKG